MDFNLRIVAVASNAGGLHFVDVSVPASPQLLRTITVATSQVEIVSDIAYATVGTTIQAYDLLTGELRETLSLGGSSIIALAREGTMLYALDSGNRLRAIDIGGFQMLALGTLTLPAGGGKLFVGNGVAYVGAGGGFVTANVSNPISLVLLSGVDAANLVGQAVVANGSGLAVAVGSIPGPVFPQVVNALDVLNVSDPTNTAGFLTRINLPSAPSSVALAAGIAFVATGTSGLQVINYLPFDNRGTAPTVSVNTPAPDVDPATPGIQVVEGTTLPIRAAISDDVQVRNVELLVNGQVVANDVSFPFDFFAIAPVITPTSSTLTVQVRATDTGGNATLSDSLTLNLVPDTVSPVIVSMDPADGSIKGQNQRTVRVRFSEALDPATISNATFRLINSQGDQVMPLDIGLRNNDQLVQLTFDTLPAGTYQVVIDATNVTDRGGNVLGGADVVSRFTVGVFTAFWTNPAGGDWNTPSNWSTGVVPGANDDVLIDVPDGNVVITHSSEAHSVRSLATNETLLLSGGVLSIASDSTVTGTFTLSGGDLGGTGTLKVTGTMNWTAGGMGGTGRTLVTGRLNLTGPDAKRLGGGRVLENAGIGTWAGGGIEGNGATVSNLPGAVLDLQSDGDFLRLIQFPSGPASFSNAGTLRKSAGTGTTSIWFGVGFTNAGTVEVLTGTLVLGGGTSPGAFAVAAGATLSFPGGHTLAASSSVTGAGNVRLTGSSFTIAGTYDVGGDTFLSASVANISSQQFTVGGSLTVPVGFAAVANFTGVVSVGGSMTVQGDGGTANFAGVVTVGNVLTVTSTGGNLTNNNVGANFNGSTTVGSLVLNGHAGSTTGEGYLGGSGTVTVNGLLSWLGGGMGGTGRTIANGGMAISGSIRKSLGAGRILDNAGAATWSGSRIDTDGGTFNNLAGATLTLLGDGGVMGRVQFPTGGAVFANAGTLRKTAGAGTTSLGFEVSFSNSGTVEVLTGTLDLGGGTSSGAFVAAAGTTLRLNNQTLTATSSVTGAGNVNLSSANVSGTFDLDGNLIIDGGVVTVGGSVTAGNLTLLSGAPTFNGPVTVGGALTFTRATGTGVLTSAFNGPVTAGSLSLLGDNGHWWRLGGSGTVTVTGLTTWTGGSMEGTGRTVTLGGLAIDGGEFKGLSGRVLENGGTGTWTGGANFDLSGGAVFANLAGVTFDVRTDRSFVYAGGAAPAVTNAGVWRKTAGAGTASVNVPFTNAGTVEVLTGTLALNGGGTSTGAFTVAAGATLRLQGGHNLAVGSSVTGAGSVSASGGSVAGVFDIGGGLAADGVTFTSAAVGVGGTWTATGTVAVAGVVTAGGLLVRSGVATFNGPVQVAGLVAIESANQSNPTAAFNADTTVGALSFLGGGFNNANPRLDGSGTVTVTGPTTWAMGTMSGTGRTVALGGLAIVGGEGKVLSGRTLENAGAGTWSGSGNIDLSSGAVFANRAGATFDVQNAQSFVYAGGANPAVTNAGTFRKSAGAGTTSINVPFHNAGTVEALVGTLVFVGGYTQTGGSTVLSGGTVSGGLIDIQGGSLSGSGTVNASVRNAGAVSPGGAGAGRLTINGNYTQLATGVLNIELGGVSAGSQYDQLVVSGSVTLDGTLNVTLINGFVPSSGNSFQILTFASRTGAFATINGLDLGGGLFLTPGYNTTNFALTVV